MRALGTFLLALLAPTTALAQDAVMNKDSIACWSHSDFMALVGGEYRMNYWGSHQQKRDYMAQGRCFALRRGERVKIERLMTSPYARIARVRKEGSARSFWTDQAFSGW